jgi:hypothetical protein
MAPVTRLNGTIQVACTSPGTMASSFARPLERQSRRSPASRRLAANDGKPLHFRKRVRRQEQAPRRNALEMANLAGRVSIHRWRVSMRRGRTSSQVTLNRREAVKVGNPGDPGMQRLSKEGKQHVRVGQGALCPAYVARPANAVEPIAETAVIERSRMR